MGPKLLFEDGSVQHAGMSQEPYAGWDGLPINVHPGKGLPDRNGQLARPAPAIEAAVLLRFGAL